MRRPRIAITVGDPAGIGPEIAQSAVADARVLEVCDPVLFGEAHVPGVRMGEASAAGGRAAYDAIVRAVEAAQRGEVDAVATAPINKLAFSRAGFPWKGHTDLLAALCGVPTVRMLFWAPSLVVTLVTVHVPLADVPRLVTPKAVDDTVTLTEAWLRRLGVQTPRIAVAGLNPHAGESGLIGHEDAAVLAPTVADLVARGLRVSGPWPADTVFGRAVRGEFDAVIACYHDQGLIPIKMLAFGDAVNVTLGLPIVRTSVDHGTAYDIAGRGVAKADSLVSAVRLAARLARATMPSAEAPA
jgi:4-hydroxythreonine-4-phosphate dehydrogenase